MRESTLNPLQPSHQQELEGEDPLLRDPSPPFIELAARLMEPAHRYHDYSVVGMENIPDKGAGLLVVNHSLATYDGFLLGLEVFRQRRRMLVGLGDNLIFKTPVLKDLALASGIYPANPTNGKRLLAHGHLMGVAPGGMWESLRPSTQKYQLRWDDRRGFVRLAMEAQVPIILAACPRADDLYEVRPSRLTEMAYHLLKIPIPLATGVGPTLIPRKIKLTHYIAPPLYPPDPKWEDFEEVVESWHRQVIRRMEELMLKALDGG